MMAMDKAIAGLALFSIPWASSWKRIDWHFKRGKRSQSGLFNGVSTVLASILFTAALLRPPQPWLVRLPIWVGFGLASLLVAAYVCLLYRYGASVSNGKALWPLVIGLVLYTWLWGLVAVYTRQAYIFREYHVYGGQILDQGKPAAGKRIQMVDVSEVEAGMPE